MTPEEFKAWRKITMGWTQTEAADALGISRGSVELYERGARRDGDQRPVEIPPTIRRLATLLAGLRSLSSRIENLRKANDLMRSGKMGTFDQSSGKRIDTTDDTMAMNDGLIADLIPLAESYEEAIAATKRGYEKPAG